jgi:hypothetical protein
VVKFLMDNPDEELTRGDIAVKFDTFGGGVDTVLQIACARGVLKKGRNSDMEVVWMLGTNKNVVLDEFVPPEVPDLVKAASAMVTTPQLEMSGFPEIRKKTPLMDEKTRRRVEFHAWLGKFDVQDSAEFPESFLTEVRAMVKTYAGEANRSFNIVKVANGRWGVERTA